MGRPTTYTDELGEEICEAIANSQDGIEVLCKKNKHWPQPRCIYKWLVKYPSFGQAYTHAKDTQVECLVDQIMDIASDEGRDVFVADDGTPHFNSVALQRARLKIDSIKWIACKLKAKKYGDHKQDKEDTQDDFVSLNRDKIIE